MMEGGVFFFGGGWEGYGRDDAPPARAILSLEVKVFQCGDGGATAEIIPPPPRTLSSFVGGDGVSTAFENGVGRMSMERKWWGRVA